MPLKFTKMHGLGNDFVVFDAINQSVSLSTEQVRFIANRRFGVGCDQLLLVESAQQSGVDFRYRIYNADGSEVQQCGNGARCFARFVRDKGLSDKDAIVVETASGIITLHIEADGQVRVNMGKPDFNPAALPFRAEREQLVYEIPVGDELLRIGAVSMGNPHAVLQVEDVTLAPVERLGPLLESHPLFPERVNVGFMQVVDKSHIRLRVYERGAAETLACGTGACAAVAVGHRWGLLADEVRVSLPGGELLIHWAGQGGELWMTGPAITVFEGTIVL
ncbi:MAG: diaminopimelate epimerase [Gammaproteobacteria bacterium]|nr:diaminopimelate epimerase [Gammaproteobacteria bacterium]MCW8840736.1 diaminopimelate epimerase [Gammaproteobacteria bacterium]MCW8958377.1 diaminopimelate epimerase [Gammaproteobacteria bacterium]MCW8972615.1 diaminopimelate epimerase [Gammaproteobacteria bacterium]MCW8992543.1 diaminopimelate epimerase [Gammaproteobacteria bacterium]